MQITIINDCADENAKLRQISRMSSLVKNSSVSCFGVRSDLEAAGFLVDALDAFEDREGVVVVNVARREGKAKRWKNGTPFGFFRYKKILIVSSVDGLTLALVKKLGILKEFNIVDIPEVLAFIDGEALDEKTRKRITDSQFRSFDFLPRLTAWVLEGRDLPCQKYDLDEIPDMPKAVWFIDNFGNTKTTLLKEDLGSLSKNVEVKIGDNVHTLPVFDKLKDVPTDSLALITGSSGQGHQRFLEIVLQGASAAKKLGIAEGFPIKLTE